MGGIIQTQPVREEDGWQDDGWTWYWEGGSPQGFWKKKKDMMRHAKKKAQKAANNCKRKFPNAEDCGTLIFVRFRGKTKDKTEVVEPEV